MLIKQIIDMYDLLDDGRVDGAAVVNFMRPLTPRWTRRPIPWWAPGAPPTW